MPLRNLKDLRVLVTGASSGIGRELAWQLANRGSHVLATARRKTKLVELADSFAKNLLSNPIAPLAPSSGRGAGGEGPFGLAIGSPNAEKSWTSGSIQFLAGDITDAKFRSQLFVWCDENWQSLDVLINNAGVGAIGRFAVASPDRMRKVMELDFFAPVELTRIFLPLLRRGRRPAIMNIGSILSHRAVPLKSEYCAAKFALRGWSEALRCELAGEKIDVLQISPSTTRSEFFESLVDTDSNQKSRSIGSLSPQRVAEIAIAGLVHSRREIILTMGGKGLVWAGRFFPNLVDRILSWQRHEPKARKKT